jgi:hypothetical protein
MIEDKDFVIVPPMIVGEIFPSDIKQCTTYKGMLKVNGNICMSCRGTGEMKV